MHTKMNGPKCLLGEKMAPAKVKFIINIHNKGHSGDKGQRSYQHSFLSRKALARREREMYQFIA